MENTQTKLFETGNDLRQVEKSGNPSGSAPGIQNGRGTDYPALSSIDQNMIDIVSTYIKKLPNNNTKKHVARVMINFIIKSANL